MCWGGGGDCRSLSTLSLRWMSSFFNTTWRSVDHFLNATTNAAAIAACSPLLANQAPFANTTRLVFERSDLLFDLHLMSNNHTPGKHWPSRAYQAFALRGQQQRLLLGVMFVFEEVQVQSLRTLQRVLPGLLQGSCLCVSFYGYVTAHGCLMQPAPWLGRIGSYATLACKPEVVTASRFPHAILCCEGCIVYPMVAYTCIVLTAKWKKWRSPHCRTNR